MNRGNAIEDEEGIHVKSTITPDLPWAVGRRLPAVSLLLRRGSAEFLLHFRFIEEDPEVVILCAWRSVEILLYFKTFPPTKYFFVRFG